MEKLNYGECAKHQGQSMWNCSECQMEELIRETTLIPKRVKTKISPYKPTMEINESNACWIAHCVNKKRKSPSELVLNIEIQSEKIKARLMRMDKGISSTIGTGESKHDINEAIRQVIDKYAMSNIMSGVLFEFASKAKTKATKK